MELGQLTVTVERDGETVEVQVDLDPNSLTLRESVRVERELGRKRAAALFSGGELAVTPSVIQVILWAKLASKFPDLGIDDFDLDLGQLGAALEAADEPLDLSTDEIEAALFQTGEPLKEAGVSKA